MADPERPLRIKTPLGEKSFILELFRGTEAISEPFQFQLLLLTEPEETDKVEFDKLLGQEVTVTMSMPDGTPRFFHGLIHRLTQGHQVRTEKDKKPPIRYLAEMVPQFWFWKRTVQTRVFQKMTVVKVLKKVMTGITKTKWDVEDPSGGWKAREYTVQFRESDFNFASRLMEDEGLFYYFTHAKDGHTMVVSNKNSAWADVPIQAKITFDDAQGGQYDEDVISKWQKIQEVRSGKLTLWDSHSQLNGKNLEATKVITDSVAIGTATHKIKLGTNDKFEIYESSGGYSWRFDGIDPGGAEKAADLQEIFKDNVRTVGIRTEQEAIGGIIIDGASTCRQLTAGCKFTLDKHFDANGTYVLTRVDHAAAQLGTGAGGGTGGLGGKLQYENRFRCIPKDLVFRPLLQTPKPRVEGVQNAWVVGPQGQEIFTDKFGRVKVQFMWDRDGKKDTTTSCWLRVATLWAGKQFGFIRIPRVDEEVIVDFIDGDPDRPLIVGCVYNDEMMPPYKLPDNKTQAGLKTHSTDNKDKLDTFNELRFEDKKDSEEIYFHAQKDFVRIVENNDLLQVGYETKDGEHKGKDGSQTIKIYKDRTTTIDTGNETLTVLKKDRLVTIKEGDDKHEVLKGKRDHIIEKDDTTQIKSGNRVVTIDKGNDTLTVKMGNRTTEIKGDDTLTLKMGNETVNIKMGNFALTVSLGNIDIKANVGKITMEALGGILLKSGPASVKIDPMGIEMKGMMFKAKGDLTAEVQGGLMNTVKSGLMTTVKGTIVMIN